MRTRRGNRGRGADVKRPLAKSCALPRLQLSRPKSREKAKIIQYYDTNETGSRSAGRVWAREHFFFSYSVLRVVVAAMDQEHLEFMMRHQGMLGFPAARCDSEEALGSLARPRGKRARAAEVHNLSEKRRRCKINEKMKALQSLVPNSSKTDKASMLDDAIEYLKQLQLQVQMLSMRNGLYRPRVNLAGAPQLQPVSQLCSLPNQNDAQGSNPAAAMLPLTQMLGAISGARHSFDPSNQDGRHHKPLVLSSVPCTTTPEPRFLLGSSQPHLQSLQLTVSAEMILQEEVMLKNHLSATQETTSVPGHEMKPVIHGTPQAGDAQFHTCSIWKRQPQDIMPNNTESVLFMPHLHRFQSSDTDPGLRAGSE